MSVEAHLWAIKYCQYLCQPDCQDLYKRCSLNRSMYRVLLFLKLNYCVCSLCLSVSPPLHPHLHLNVFCVYWTVLFPNCIHCVYAYASAHAILYKKVMNLGSTSKEQLKERRTYPAETQMTLEEPAGFEEETCRETVCCPWAKNVILFGIRICNI